MFIEVSPQSIEIGSSMLDKRRFQFYVILRQCRTERDMHHFTRMKVFQLRECFLSGRIRLENDQIQPNLPDRPQVYRMAVD